MRCAISKAGGKKSTARIKTPRPARSPDGALSERSYCFEGAGVDFLLFLPLCFLVDLEAAEEELAAGALAAGDPAELGVSAAIAAAAIPNDNRAEAINLVMGSPAKGLTSDAENTLDRRNSSEMKIISRFFCRDIIAQRWCRLLAGGH